MKPNDEHKKAAATARNGRRRGRHSIEVPEIIYQLPREGIQDAWCAWAIDIGTHPSNFSDGKKQRKLILGFELPNEKAVFDVERGEEPFLLSKIYTMSLGERSSLYRDLVAWQGKGAIESLRHNLAALLGKPCLVNVLHKATKKNQLRATIISISPLPKATRIPAQITPSVQYSIRDGMNDVFNGLPEWVKKLISASEEMGVRQATDNSLRETAPAKPHRLVRMSEPRADEPEYSESEVRRTVTGSELTPEQEAEINALLR